MPTPHKHAALIKAWADGAEIEYLSLDNKWENVLCNTPSWSLNTVYRIKSIPKPDVVHVMNVKSALPRGTAYVDPWQVYPLLPERIRGTVQFTFDGETGKLKAVSLINED